MKMEELEPMVVTITADVSRLAAGMRQATEATDLLAWKMDGFAAMWRDDQMLSPPVLDAWRGIGGA